MNKKILFVILIAILFIILIKIGIDLNRHDDSLPITTEKISNNITYKIHNNYKNGSFNYSKRGYYIDRYKTPNSPWFYIITMGERETGGYSIKISEIIIDDNNNKVKIIVKENTPALRRTGNYGIYISCCMCRTK